MERLLATAGWDVFRATRARMAQRRQDWHAAAVLWGKISEAHRDDRNAALNYINALIQAGQINQAEPRSAAFLLKYPADPGGPLALAKIAEARGEPPQAMAQWRRVLEIVPAHRQALNRLGQFLLAASQFEEAQTCADRLATNWPAQPDSAVLGAQIAQRHGGPAAADALWSVADKKFGNNIQFLRAYGNALLEVKEYERCAAVSERLRKLALPEYFRLQGQLLAKREPYEDHTAFWENASAQFPASVDFTRKLLHAALWARKPHKAVKALEKLLRQGRLRASDADYVFGLGIALLEKGDSAAARAAVRTFLKVMRGSVEYYVSALRLDRLILASFPKRTHAAASLSRNQGRFLRMVHNAKLSDAAAAPLEQIAWLEAKLERSGATCLLDTDIDAERCGAFVQTVRGRLANRGAFSLIRLGDGEANALAYDDRLAHHFETDAGEREKVWWGQTLDHPERDVLASRVSAAIANADALGIPAKARILRDVRFGSGRPLNATRSGRGLQAVLAMLDHAADSGSLRSKVLVSAHIHQDLERWNLHRELFQGTETICVSCHAELPRLLQSSFGANVVRHVLVPPGDAMREREQRSLRDDELPLRYLDRAIAELGDDLAGCLVAVGAGYAGKIIIDHARQRGAVALDLGSIFDHWAGIHTRSYQDIA